MKHTVETAGLFKLEAINAETGETRQLTGWFPNLITDAGLNRMGTGGFVLKAHVGSGQNLPVVTDTALQTQVAETATLTGSTEGSSATAPYYGFSRRTFRFDMGAAAGNLSEVGVGWTGGLYSRSLIKDVNGDPTTVTVLANEYLSVTYEWRCYMPSADIIFQATVAGVVHDCVLRAGQVTAGHIRADGTVINGVMVTGTYANGHSARSGDIGSITQFPSGSSALAAATASSYSNNSLAADVRLDWGLNDANFGVGGIKSIVLSSSIGNYQCSFTPPIAKDNTKTLRINARVSWARKVL